jgi:hypothetical protein
VVHLQNQEGETEEETKKQAAEKPRRTEGGDSRSYQLPEPADVDLAGDGAEEVASDVDLAGGSAEEVATGVDLSVAGREEVAGRRRRFGRRGFTSGGRRG